MAISRDRTSRAGNIMDVSRARYGLVDQMQGLGDVGFAAFAGVEFGTFSPTNQRECPVPDVGLMPLPFNHTVSDTWCHCVFDGTDTLAACLDTKYVFYPWTAPGKLERGWSWNLSDWLPGSTTPPGTSPPPGGNGTNGWQPPGGAPAASGNTMLIGGGLLLAAYLLLK